MRIRHPLRRDYWFCRLLRNLSLVWSACNQAAYPQPYNQRPGLGFPLTRIGAITSLATGAIVHLGFSRYAGKWQGEVTLPRRLSSVFSVGDVLLADCFLKTKLLFCMDFNSSPDISSAEARGACEANRISAALRVVARGFMVLRLFPRCELAKRLGRPAYSCFLKRLEDLMQ